MKNIKIRKMKNEEISDVVDLWYETSLIAHCFISENYWESNKELMRTQYLPHSETYLALNDDSIVGFASIQEEYLAAIFVRQNTQGKGVGSALLNHVKDICHNLQLKVYVKNIDSVEFYKFKGFSIVSELTDNETGENEYVMEWHK